MTYQFIRTAAIPLVDIHEDAVRYREITVKGRRGYHVSLRRKSEPYMEYAHRGTSGPDAHGAGAHPHDRGSGHAESVRHLRL